MIKSPTLFLSVLLESYYCPGQVELLQLLCWQLWIGKTVGVSPPQPSATTRGVRITLSSLERCYNLTVDLFCYKSLIVIFPLSPYQATGKEIISACGHCRIL